jgi:hypothetical protein
MFLGLPDSDPLVRGTYPDPARIIKKKIVRKTLIPTVLLSLKNDVNVASKQIFTCHLEGYK